MLNGNQLEMIDEQFGIEISLPARGAENGDRVIKVSIQRCYIFTSDPVAQPIGENNQMLFEDQKEIS